MKAIFFALALIVLPMSPARATNDTDTNDACYHNNVRTALSYGTTLTDLGPWLDKTYNFSAQNRPTRPLATVVNDEQLKISAATVASSCNFAHSGWTGVGENLFVGTEAPNTSAGQWKTDRNWWIKNAVSDWVYEARFVNYAAGASSVLCNDGSSGSTCLSKIGHYTQIMWNDSTQVGCAAQYCPSGIGNFTSRESTMIVCHYSPQGNYYDGTNYLAPYPGIGIQAPAANPPAISDCNASENVSQNPLTAIIDLLLSD